MAQKKKKKPVKPQAQAMSPQKYILSGRARQLPISECWIADDWQAAGLATIIVVRRHVTGNVTLGVYLLDVFCLGVKNAHYRFNIPQDQLDFLLEQSSQAHGGMSQTDYDTVHTLIFGGIDYAAKLGIKPHKDWELAQMVLAPRDAVAPRAWEYGKNGKPLFISGPSDNVNAVLNRLNQSVGVGNYEFMHQIDSGFGDALYVHDFDDDDDDDFDDDDTEMIDFEEVK